MIDISYKTDDGTEIVERIYELNDIGVSVDLPDLPKIESRKKKNGQAYINSPMAFDIETSKIYNGRFRNKDGKITPISFMYIWQFCINGLVFVGRRWSDFNKFIMLLLDKYTATIVIYVHNLSFEYQHFKNFVPIDRVFAKSKRKVVTVDAWGYRVQFRCSWMLSNMSLDKFTTKTPGVVHNKLSGKMDYSKLRLHNTPLTDLEYAYSYNDVAGLYEAVSIRLKRDNDNISTIPLTATGYVRRRARNAMLSNPKNHDLFMATKITPELYKLLLDANRGGDTHGNLIFTGIVLDNLKSKDIKSSYPYVQCARKFPMTKFLPANLNIDDIRNIIKKGKFAVVFYATFCDIDLINYGIPPYISFGKCLVHGNVIQDNGRVLSAKIIKLALTDIDFAIIDKSYTFKYCKIESAYTSTYGYLPNELRELILHDFEQKCKLEGVDDYLYLKYKNDFNSYFGMSMQKIIDTVYKYIDGVLKPVPINNYIDKYYSRKNSFLPYFWGVWTTANARDRLYQGYFATSGLSVYGDTDSIKGFNCNRFNEAFEHLNKIRDEEVKRCGLQLDITLNINGENKTFSLGRWEDDGEYKEFIHLGAKKYCYITSADELKITVAGLSKEKGAEYIKSLAGIDSFVPGLTIPKEFSGRSTAYWHDYAKPFLMQICGEWQEIGSNVAIEDTTYTLTLTGIYDKLITDIQCEN